MDWRLFAPKFDVAYAPEKEISGVKKVLLRW